MIYYQYNLVCKKNSGSKKIPEKERLSAFEEKYNEAYINKLNDKFRTEYLREEKFIVFMSDRKYLSIKLCVAVEIAGIRESVFEDAIRETFPECDISDRKEITFKEYADELTAARSFGGGRVRSVFDYDFERAFYEPLPYDKTEEIYDLDPMTKIQCWKKAKKILASKSFMDEIGRIYSKDNSKEYFGHPVHYFISAGNWDAAMDICHLLIGALLSNGRLLSGRQTIIRNMRRDTHRDDRYKFDIQNSEGGAVVLELKQQPDYGNCATAFHEIIKKTGRLLNDNKKDTLFIFVEITGESLKDGTAVNGLINKADFIQLTEGSGTLSQAKEYLMDLVRKVDFKVDDKEEVFEYLPDKDTYTVSDIFNAYNAWYGLGLKNHVYKAYKDKKTFKVEVTEKKSTPYGELQKLIGLTKIKSVVDNIIAAGKVRCVRERMGLNIDGSSMHMIFTGTPGTAKTTVARLLSEILKEEGIIKSGRFVECGRQDLVGKYVGWTAKIVEEKFEEAQGGILFIDEAYSLVDDGLRSYGTEAINTIIQLMENYRESVIVIFAGYPDKMKDFLEQNEGLRSRISFHLQFPDYSPEELTEIMKLMCEKRQYEVSEDALDECRILFSKVSNIENFGNGRYVRNVLEQAILNQSYRLIKEQREELTRSDVTCLKPEDFTEVPLGITAKISRIGFAV